MGKLASEITFTGSIGDLSAYRMRGVDGIVVRRKGGASKEKIKKSPAFEQTRLNNAEFGGRSTATRWIMSAIKPQKAMADYNIAGPLNALMKPIQALDTKSEWGQRSVQLSKNPKILEGFSLNRKTSFDSMVRTSLAYVISRDDQMARVEIPTLLPGINFYPNQKHAMFRFIGVLGVVPDLFYSNDMGYTSPASRDNHLGCNQVTSEWFSLAKGSPAATLELNLKSFTPDDTCTLLLSIGICFGEMIDATTVQQVKYAGSAKVLGVV